MYILVEVIEREIFVSKFDTLDEARAEMKKNICEVYGVKDFSEIDEYEDCGIYKTSAWANTDHPGNCDWKIYNLAEVD